MTAVLLTPAQVAARCGLARSTLSKQRLRGGGPPFVKIGAAVRYPDDALNAWIEAQPRYASTAHAMAHTHSGKRAPFQK